MKPFKVVTDKKLTTVFDHFMYTFPFYFFKLNNGFGNVI